MNNKRGQRGQTIFELIMAMAVVVLVATALVKVVTLSVKNSTFSKEQAQATRYSQEAVEWLRGERNKDWSTFQNNAASPTWCMNTLAWSSSAPCGASTITNTAFTRLVTFDNITVGGAVVIEATVKVSWVEGDKTHVSNIVTRFTDNLVAFSLNPTPSPAGGGGGGGGNPPPPPSPPPPPTEFLTNGGFESEFANWTNSTVIVDDGDAGVEIAPGHNSPNSAGMYANGPTSNGNVQVKLTHDGFWVSSGDYCATAWINIAGDTRVNFTMLVTGSTIITAPKTNGWQQLKKTVSYSQDTLIAVEFAISAGRDRVYYVSVDDVSFKNGACL